MSYTETLEPLRGYTVELVAMIDPEDPRKDYEHLGVMACFHRRYDLGDTDADEVSTLRGAMDDARRPLRFAVIERYCRIKFGSTVVIPLGLIDHSGISMYAGGGAHWQDGGGWDSGTVGFIFDTAATRERCGTDPEHVAAALMAEINEYDQYLTGDVWGARVLDEAGNIVEDLWGLYGSEYAQETAYSLVPEEPAQRLLTDEEQGPLYDAVIRMCQAFGTTTEATYDAAHRLLATITVPVEES